MTNNPSSELNFNVGGKRYEISRSLFESHSECMLAKIVSKQWQQDPESEIFIERDGTIFRYVLNCLRDGEVQIPISETKAALVTELEYYNVAYDVDKIDDSREQMVKLIPTYENFVQRLQDQAATAHDVYRTNSIAMYCVEQFFLQHLFKGSSRATQETSSPGQNTPALFGSAPYSEPLPPPQPSFGSTAETNATSNLKVIRAVTEGKSMFHDPVSPIKSAADKVIQHFRALRRFQNVEYIVQSVNFQIGALGLEIVSCQDHSTVPDLFGSNKAGITFNIRQLDL